MKIESYFIKDRWIFRSIPYFGITYFKCSASVDIHFNWFWFTAGISILKNKQK